jgi:hypothetical protein
MPLSSDDVLAFMQQLTLLGPGQDRAPIIGWAQDHSEDLLAAVQAIETLDAVRAGVLRLLPDLGLDPERTVAVLRGAGQALFTSQSADMLAATRDPAWLGLCVIELAERVPGFEADPLQRAVQLATRGYENTPELPKGPGEVLWAMAERAEHVGWEDRAEPLFEAALAAPFESLEHASQVRLLVALRRLERDEDGAETLLEQVVGFPDAPRQSRVHAGWILGLRAQERGDVPTARARLEACLADVDPDQDGDAAQRIAEALAALEG